MGWQRNTIREENALSVNISYTLPCRRPAINLFPLGVLTKPDRIPAGEESNWLPFIRNEKETLENNWYCVKQPNSHDLKQGVSWAQARTREDEFFSMTVPWSELDPMYQKYLRTSNLVDRLSSILSDLISKRSVTKRLPS